MRAGKILFKYGTTLLFSLYPVFFLYSINAAQLRFSQVWFPALMMIVLATLLFFTIRFLAGCRVNNIELITPVILIFIFSYGSFYETLQGFTLSGIMVGRNLFLLPCFFLFLIGIVIYLGRSTSKSVYNITCIVLLSLILQPPVKMLLDYKITKAVEYRGNYVTTKVNPAGGLYKPDIYYIILDGYTSESVFSSVHKFDNGNFIKKLSDLDFKVLGNAHSNYPITYFSLASSLNMQYIHTTTAPVEDRLTIAAIDEMISDNRVSNFLKTRGYQYILFESGFETLKRRPDKNDRFISLNGFRLLNDASPDKDFSVLLIRSSVFRVLEERISYFSYNLYRQRILNVFSIMPEIAKERQPKFVFAHIMIPHPPYIFDKNGNEINVANIGEVWSRQGYLEQVQYLNGRMPMLLQNIIHTDNGRDKVIVVQGDHGSRTLDQSSTMWKTERFGILNAIYSQNKKLNDELLHLSDLTPVNTFRLILNTCFNADLHFLDNRSFYSEYHEPFVFSKMDLNKQ